MADNANADIGGRVSYPEVDTSPVMELSGDIIVEQPINVEEGIVDNKIFVAVGKELKESISTLKWALHNSKGKQICIIYVHVPAKWIPSPMGGKRLARDVGEMELKAFRDREQQEMLSILDSYLNICATSGVCVEKMHIEVDSTIEQGIVELISQQRIGELVMGAAADRSYSRNMMEPKSGKAKFVRQHAPDYCHIWFVCKGCLIYTRRGVNLTQPLGEGSSSSPAPTYFSEFSYLDLKKATKSFAPSSKIGEGGYGSIYKGLLCQTHVAIKIPNPNSMQGPNEFNQELDILSKVRHPNLVTLVGACPKSGALVYEYLSGGSLEERLSCKDNNNAPPLPWQTRIRIATELCSALIFLHSRRPICIIHGDLKPGNILLDDNLVCKLSGFGVCHVVSSDDTTTIEQTALLFSNEPSKGTLTYMDPEFFITGELTPKSDVYSFGIILLRLLTGKLSAFGLAKQVEHALVKGTLGSILDPLAGDWPFVQATAERLARMALWCCDLNRRNRPDLGSDVWRVLEPMKASC